MTSSQLPIHLPTKKTETNFNPKYRPLTKINFRENRTYTPEERVQFVQNISQFMSPGGHRSFFSGKNEQGVNGMAVLYNLIQQQHKKGKPISVPAGAIAEKLKVTREEVSNAATMIATVLGYRAERKHSGALPAKESTHQRVIQAIIEAHKKAKNNSTINAEELEKIIVEKTGCVVSVTTMWRTLARLNKIGTKKVILHAPQNSTLFKGIANVAAKYQRQETPLNNLVQRRKTFKKLV